MMAAVTTTDSPTVWIGHNLLPCPLDSLLGATTPGPSMFQLHDEEMEAAHASSTTSGQKRLGATSFDRSTSRIGQIFESTPTATHSFHHDQLDDLASHCSRPLAAVPQLVWPDTAAAGATSVSPSSHRVDICSSSSNHPTSLAPVLPSKSPHCAYAPEVGDSMSASAQYFASSSSSECYQPPAKLRRLCGGGARLPSVPSAIECSTAQRQLTNQPRNGGVKRRLGMSSTRASRHKPSYPGLLQRLEFPPRPQPSPFALPSGATNSMNIPVTVESVDRSSTGGGRELMSCLSSGASDTSEALCFAEVAQLDSADSVAGDGGLRHWEGMYKDSQKSEPSVGVVASPSVLSNSPPLQFWHDHSNSGCRDGRNDTSVSPLNVGEAAYCLVDKVLDPCEYSCLSDGRPSATMMSLSVPTHSPSPPTPLDSLRVFAPLLAVEQRRFGEGAEGLVVSAHDATARSANAAQNLKSQISPPVAHCSTKWQSPSGEAGSFRCSGPRRLVDLLSAELRECGSLERSATPSRNCSRPTLAAAKRKGPAGRTGRLVVESFDALARSHPFHLGKVVGIEHEADPVANGSDCGADRGVAVPAIETISAEYTNGEYYPWLDLLSSSAAWPDASHGRYTDGDALSTSHDDGQSGFYSAHGFDGPCNNNNTNNGMMALDSLFVDNASSCSSLSSPPLTTSWDCLPSAYLREQPSESSGASRSSAFVPSAPSPSQLFSVDVAESVFMRNEVVLGAPSVLETGGGSLVGSHLGTGLQCL